MAFRQGTPLHGMTKTGGELLSENLSEFLEQKFWRHSDFPDNMMDSVSLLEVTKSLETATCEFLPEIVYTHHVGDLNIDHRITKKAVETAFRPHQKVL